MSIGLLLQNNVTYIIEMSTQNYLHLGEKSLLAISQTYTQDHRVFWILPICPSTHFGGQIISMAPPRGISREAMAGRLGVVQLHSGVGSQGSVNLWGSILTG